MVLYAFQSIDKIPGSESFIQELTEKYGSTAFRTLDKSGLKLNVGINDSDYNKTVLDWVYLNESNDDREVDVFKLSSKYGTAPITGYVFEHGELRCATEGRTKQYFNVTPEKKIGLEIIVEKEK
ncbi:MAG: hypothetical protein ACQESE_02630 [Nanobdellota archaeon]